MGNETLLNAVLLAVSLGISYVIVKELVISQFRIGQDLEIGVTVILALAIFVSLYFMRKSAGGGG